MLCGHCADIKSFVDELLSFNTNRVPLLYAACILGCYSSRRMDLLDYGKAGHDTWIAVCIVHIYEISLLSFNPAHFVHMHSYDRGAHPGTFRYTL